MSIYWKKANMIIAFLWNLKFMKLVSRCKRLHDDLLSIIMNFFDKDKRHTISDSYSKIHIQGSTTKYFFWRCHSLIISQKINHELSFNYWNNLWFFYVSHKSFCFRRSKVNFCGISFLLVSWLRAVDSHGILYNEDLCLQQKIHMEHNWSRLASE